MGLLGIGKILVLILIIGAVWYGFKFLSRRGLGAADQNSQRNIGTKQNKDTNDATQDMESCAVCGTFVPNAVAKNCGRASCPYPD